MPDDDRIDDTMAPCCAGGCAPDKSHEIKVIKEQSRDAAETRPLLATETDMSTAASTSERFNPHDLAHDLAQQAAGHGIHGHFQKVGDSIAGFPRVCVHGVACTVGLLVFGAAATVAVMAYNRTTSCSWSNQDCRFTKCCVELGNQCYQKDPFWANCRRDCYPGFIDPFDHKPWACNLLQPLPGQPFGVQPGVQQVPGQFNGAPGCSPAGADCRWSKCCQDPSMQCHQKNNFWAACMAQCTPGMIDVNDHQPWTCNVLR